MTGPIRVAVPAARVAPPHTIRFPLQRINSEVKNQVGRLLKRVLNVPGRCRDRHRDCGFPASLATISRKAQSIFCECDECALDALGGVLKAILWPAVATFCYC